MKYRIGMIGSGSISRSHTYGFDRLNTYYDDVQVEKSVICSPHITEEKAKDMGWNEIAYDWKTVVTRDDIDVIDICAYDYLHYNIAKAAMENGKMVICEKPLADTYEQAVELAEIAESKNIRATVCTNYRYIHALRCIAHLVKSGELGEIRLIHGSFKMGWAIDPNGGMNWRLNHRYSPCGVLGDLGTHVIDLCRYIGLEFKDVCGMNEVYGKVRPEGNQLVTTESNELSAFTARFTNNALGNFEFSRVTMGSSGMMFEVHGTRGSVKYHKYDFNNLEVLIPHLYPDFKWEYGKVEAVEILPFDYKWDDGFDQMDTYTLLFHDFLTDNGNAPKLEDGVECCRIVGALL